MSKMPRRLTLALTIVFSLAITTVVAVAATPEDSPLTRRQALMDATAAAAALSGGMLKGEIPYDPKAANSAITTFWAVSRNYGFLFPEGSDTGKTRASPNIWKDRDGFDEQFATFTSRAEAAKEAAGKKGPPDLAAFKSVVTPVLQTCKSCHRDYRLSE